MSMRLLVLHGPNVNLLGEREGTVGGRFEDLNSALRVRAASHGVELKIVQSNHEGVLIDSLHSERRSIHGVVVNPAGLFGSYALKDALEAVGVPAVEVQLNALRARQSVVKEACVAQLSGKGFEGYLQAIDKLAGKELSASREPVKAAAPGKAKTLGRKAGGADKADKPEKVEKGKTIGRGSKEPLAADLLSRALVREKISERLSGKLTPAGLVTWARAQYLEVQRGAPAESGYRDMLEDSLQTLTLSTMPTSRLSDDQLVELMTQLEG